jgi:hypothetical protein
VNNGWEKWFGGDAEVIIGIILNVRRSTDHERKSGLPSLEVGSKIQACLELKILQKENRFNIPYLRHGRIAHQITHQLFNLSH